MKEKLISKTIIDATTIEYFSEPGNHYLIVISCEKNYVSQVYTDKAFADEKHTLLLSRINDKNSWPEICEIMSDRK